MAATAARRPPPKPVAAPPAPKSELGLESVNAVEKMAARVLEELKQFRRDADIIPVYGSDKRLARIEIRYK